MSRELYLLSPHVSLWRVAGQLYFTSLLFLLFTCEYRSKISTTITNMNEVHYEMYIRISHSLLSKIPIFSPALYDGETWIRTLREEDALQVFENEVLGKILLGLRSLKRLSSL
jgi:hypothetical protein